MLLAANTKGFVYQPFIPDGPPPLPKGEEASLAPLRTDGSRREQPLDEHARGDPADQDDVAQRNPPPQPPPARRDDLALPDARGPQGEGECDLVSRVADCGG